MHKVSIITPAYKAEKFLERAVRSVLAQTYDNWEMLIISDDGVDYIPILKNCGISDPRIKFLSTGKVGSGPVNAGNTGFHNATGDVIAFLDGDDEFMPEKLSLCMEKIDKYPLISCALDVCDSNGKNLRYVGKGSDGALKSSEYKSVNFSMDSMIVFDRRKIPITYDVNTPYLEDIEFMIHCFVYTGEVYHFGKPLHKYYKQPNSISTSSGIHKHFIETKRDLIKRIEDGYYNFVEAAAKLATIKFLNASIKAEQEFERVLQKDKTALFENAIDGWDKNNY